MSTRHRGGYEILYLWFKDESRSIALREGAGISWCEQELSDTWLDAFDNALPGEPNYPYQDRDSHMTRLYGS